MGSINAGFKTPEPEELKPSESFIPAGLTPKAGKTTQITLQLLPDTNPRESDTVPADKAARKATGFYNATPELLNGMVFLLYHTRS